MTRNKKIIIILFAIAILLIAVWFSLDKITRCKLIYGKNICNFYAMMDTQNPSVSDFDNMMNLCRGMSDVPKKDSCFECIAGTFVYIAIEKARQACDEIKEFNGVHSKENCYIQIQKPIEERLVESTIVEFMTVRIERNEEVALFWLTDKAKEQYSQPSFSLIGTSNPHFASYKILEIKKLDSTKFQFKVRIYEEYTDEGIIGYFDETLSVIKSNEVYMIDSLEERSDYFNL